MPSLFSRSVGWVVKVAKSVSKMANIAKIGVLFVWEDELGLRVVGSPAMLDKFYASKNCKTCNQNGTWEESAKADSKSLSSGKAKVEIDVKASNSELIKTMATEMTVTKLPCRLEFMASKEAMTWLDIELKKDFIEQGKKPVRRIPWGNPDYTPKCWAGKLWEWEKVSNPRHKQAHPPDTWVKLIDVLQATIANRLNEKNIDPAQYISEKYTKEMDSKKRMTRGLKVISEIELTGEHLAGEGEDKSEIITDDSLCIVKDEASNVDD